MFFSFTLSHAYVRRFLGGTIRRKV